MVADTFNPSFKKDAFKTPEQPVWIGRCVDMQLQDTPGDYKAQYPNSPDQRIAVKFEPLSYRPREGQFRIETMGLSFSKNGKLYKFLQSVAAISPDREVPDYAAMKSYMLNKVFEAQARPLNNRDDAPTYLHIIREVSEAEAATVQPRGPQPATAEGTTQTASSPPVDTSPAAVEALALELVGEQGGSTDELRARLLADMKFKGNSVLAGGIFSGELLKRLVQDGRLTTDGTTYRRN
jgi:hypothetical protein